MQTEAIRIQPGKDRQLLVCRGTGCESQKADVIYFALLDELQKAGLADKTEVKFTGCHGLCQMGPTIIIEPAGTFYCNVTPEDVPEIIASDLGKGVVVDRLIFLDPKGKKKVLSYRDMDFFDRSGGLYCATAVSSILRTSTTTSKWGATRRSRRPSR